MHLPFVGTLGRSPNCSLDSPNQARIKAHSRCACSQLLTIVGNHREPESACANDSQASLRPLALLWPLDQRRRLDSRKQVLAVVMSVNLIAELS